MREKVILPAVHDKDLIKLLEEFGLREKLERNQLKCKSCGRKLTFENLGGLIVKQDGILLLCNYMECIETAKEEGEDNNDTD